MAGKPSGQPTIQKRCRAEYDKLIKDHPELAKRGRKMEAAGIVAKAMGYDDENAARRVYDYLGHTGKVPVLVEAPLPPPDPQVIFEQAKILNAEKIKRDSTRGKAVYSMPDSRPFGLLFSSDEHLDNSGCDLATLEDMAGVVAATDGLYAGLHGDLRDNFIIRKLMSAQLGSHYHPKDQLKLVDYYLSLFGEDKILYLVGGNHDNWEESLSGVDTLQRLAQARRILYDSDQFFIRLKCDSANYGLLVRHKWRMNSSYSPTHTCMQATRMGLAPEAPDLVVMGHHHDPAITYWQWYGKMRVAIKTGSAKRNDEFAHKVGFPEGGFMAPVVIFWPDQRKMLAFPDYREGADYLRYLRETQG
jgi:hypothetical protein